MKNILAVLIVISSLGIFNDAKAATYSCPSGGWLSGTSCVYWPSCPNGSTILSSGVCGYYQQSSYCSTGWKMSVVAGGSAYNYAPTGGTSNKCVTSQGWYCPSGYPFMNSAFTTCYTSGSSYCPSNSVYQSVANGGGSGASWPYGTCWPLTASPTPICSTGYTLSADASTCTKSATYTPTCSIAGSTLVGTQCSYPATVNYSCNFGDTLFKDTATGTWKCQPPKLTTAARTNYACTDQDGNGAIDSFVAGTSKTKCRPDLLAYIGEPVWYCPVVSGDPDQIVAGTVAWSLDGSLQNATGYTVTGPLGAPIASSMKWVGGTTCSYQPPTVDGLYSYTTRHCTDPTHVLDATGMFCIPPKTPTSSTLTTPMACSGSDVLNGSTCTPALQTYQAAMTTTYACPSTLPSGTVLDPTTHLCHVPMITQPPTPVSTLVCGSNAKLNATTGQCDYVSIPAVNVGGSYSCPAGYTIGTGANVGWCIPTPSWAYPAAWDWKQYSCPDGGTLGLDANGNPNGLCYLP